MVSRAAITLRLIFFALGAVMVLPLAAQQISIQRRISPAQIDILQRTLRSLPKGKIRLRVWPLPMPTHLSKPSSEEPSFRLAEHLPPISAAEASVSLDPAVEVESLCAQLGHVLKRCGYSVRIDTIDGSGPGYD